jgi:hypothetical protein
MQRDNPEHRTDKTTYKESYDYGASPSRTLHGQDVDPPTVRDRLTARAEAIRAGDKVTADLLVEAATTLYWDRKLLAAYIAAWMAANDQMRENDIEPRELWPTQSVSAQRQADAVNREAIGCRAT